MGILLFGQALASAMKNLLVGLEFSRELAQKIDGGLQIGIEIVKESQQALEKLLETYGKHGKMLLSEVSDEMTIEEIAKTIQQLKDLFEQIPGDIDSMLKEEGKIKPLYQKILSLLKISPIYDPEGWIGYEIMPPDNPVFIPKYLPDGVPKGYKMYGIACPQQLVGPKPTQCTKPKVVRSSCQKKRKCCN